MILVEEMPCQTPEKSEAAARIVGEKEVGWTAFPQGVEVSCLGVDAGAFHLYVDEHVAPQVATDLRLVLVIEQPGEMVVGRRVEWGMVAKVNAGLQAHDTAEQEEVDIKRVL